MAPIPYFLTQSDLRQILRQMGHRPRRTRGQNFLVDRNLMHFVLRAAELTPKDIVLEIGVGLGAMTSYMLQQAQHVIGIEIEPSLYHYANDALKDVPNLTLLHGDVLSRKSEINPQLMSSLRTQMETGGILKCVANLPYAVATPIILNLLSSDLRIERMIFTLQKEVADKLCAQAGDTHYGPVAILTQVHAKVKRLREVPPDVFWPRPRVGSAILGFWPENQRGKNIYDMKLFETLIRGLFRQRRKQLRNSLLRLPLLKYVSQEDVLDIFKRLSLAKSIRPQEVSIEQYVGLVNELISASSTIAMKSEKPL